jgi:hypothetical protein
MRIQRYKNIAEATYHQNWPFLGTLSLEEGASPTYTMIGVQEGMYNMFTYTYKMLHTQSTSCAPQYKRASGATRHHRINPAE